MDHILQSRFYEEREASDHRYERRDYDHIDLNFHEVIQNIEL